MLLGEPDKLLPSFVKSNNIGGIITDFTPLRKPMKWLDDVTRKLPKSVPVCQVCVYLNAILCFSSSATMYLS